MAETSERIHTRRKQLGEGICVGQPHRIQQHLTFSFLPKPENRSPTVTQEFFQIYLDGLSLPFSPARISDFPGLSLCLQPTNTSPLHPAETTLYFPDSGGGSRGKASISIPPISPSSHQTPEEVSFLQTQAKPSNPCSRSHTFPHPQEFALLIAHPFSCTFRSQRNVL